MKLSRLNKYANDLVIRLMNDDKALVKDIGTNLNDIHLYTQSLLEETVRLSVIQGSDGVVNYDALESKFNGMISKIATFSNNTYSTIAKKNDKFTEKSFLDYRKEFESSLKDMGFNVKHTPGSNVQEAIGEGSLDVVFGGTPKKSFEKHLLGLLKAGSEPAKIIKTVSQEHVALIQRQLAFGLSKGKGFSWTRDKVIREMFPKGVSQNIQKRMEYNVTRILRTSYMNAINNDTTEFVANNPQAFYGSIRVADGRPCIACIAKDGTYYKPGEQLVDHPNGQCVLSPLTYPLEYFETGKITKPIPNPFGKTLKQKFYQSSEATQRKLMGNNMLFKLWKQEKFDIEALVLPSGNPMSYRQAIMNLDKIGGMSFPRVSFFNAAVKQSLNSVMDPKDRMSPNHLVVRRKPNACPTKGKKLNEGLIMDNFIMEAKAGLTCPNSYNVDQYGDGSEYIDSNISPEKKAKILAMHEEYLDDPFTFNEKMRELNVMTRKDINGQEYFMIPKNSVDDRMFLKQETKTKIAKSPTDDVVDVDFDDIMGLDTEIDLFSDVGLEKIKFDRDGVARVVLDKDLVEHQTLKIYRVKNSKGKDVYVFDMKVQADLAEDIIKHSKGIQFDANPSSPRFNPDRINLPHVDPGTRSGTVPKLVYREINSSGNQLNLQTPNFKIYGRVRDGLYDGAPYTKSHALTGRIFYESTRDKLEDALFEFKWRMGKLQIGRGDYIKRFKGKSLDLKEFLKPINVKSREDYLKARLSWSEGSPVSKSDIKKIRGEFQNGRLTYYKDFNPTGPTTLFHDMRPAYFEKVFDAKGLLSTDMRIMTGRSTLQEGMSTMADINTGGSNGVFTRVTKKDTIDSAGGGKIRLIIDKDELNRIDWYGFDTDMWGKTDRIKGEWRGRKHYTSAQNKLQNDNEQIFRDQIHFSKIKGVIVSDKDDYEDIIAMFKRKGVSEVNGKSIDDFVVYKPRFSEGEIDIARFYGKKGSSVEPPKPKPPKPPEPPSPEKPPKPPEPPAPGKADNDFGKQLGTKDVKSTVIKDDFVEVTYTDGTFVHSYSGTSVDGVKLKNYNQVTSDFIDSDVIQKVGLKGSTVYQEQFIVTKKYDTLDSFLQTSLTKTEKAQDNLNKAIKQYFFDSKEGSDMMLHQVLTDNWLGTKDVITGYSWSKPNFTDMKSFWKPGTNTPSHKSIFNHLSNKHGDFKFHKDTIAKMEKFLDEMDFKAGYTAFRENVINHYKKTLGDDFNEDVAGRVALRLMKLKENNYVIHTDELGQLSWGKKVKGGIEPPKPKPPKPKPPEPEVKPPSPKELEKELEKPVEPKSKNIEDDITIGDIYDPKSLSGYQKDIIKSSKSFNNVPVSGEMPKAAVHVKKDYNFNFPSHVNVDTKNVKPGLSFEEIDSVWEKYKKELTKYGDTGNAHVDVQKDLFEAISKSLNKGKFAKSYGQVFDKPPTVAPSTLVPKNAAGCYWPTKHQIGMAKNASTSKLGYFKVMVHESYHATGGAFSTNTQWLGFNVVGMTDGIAGDMVEGLTELAARAFVKKLTNQSVHATYHTQVNGMKNCLSFVANNDMKRIKLIMNDLSKSGGTFNGADDILYLHYKKTWGKEAVFTKEQFDNAFVQLFKGKKVPKNHIWNINTQQFEEELAKYI